MKKTRFTENQIIAILKEGDGQAEVTVGSMILDGRDGSFLIAPATTCTSLSCAHGGAW